MYIVFAIELPIVLPIVLPIALPIVLPIALPIVLPLLCCIQQVRASEKVEASRLGFPRKSGLSNAYAARTQQ